MWRSERGFRETGSLNCSYHHLLWGMWGRPPTRKMNELLWWTASEFTGTSVWASSYKLNYSRESAWTSRLQCRANNRKHCFSISLTTSLVVCFILLMWCLNFSSGDQWNLIICSDCVSSSRLDHGGEQRLKPGLKKCEWIQFDSWEHNSTQSSPP